MDGLRSQGRGCPVGVDKVCSRVLGRGWTSFTGSGLSSGRGQGLFTGSGGVDGLRSRGRACTRLVHMFTWFARVGVEGVSFTACGGHDLLVRA